MHTPDTECIGCVRVCYFVGCDTGWPFADLSQFHTHTRIAYFIFSYSFLFVLIHTPFLSVFCAAMPSRVGATCLQPQLLRCYYCGGGITPSRPGEPKHPHWEPKQPLRRFVLPRLPSDPDHGVKPRYFHANCEAGMHMSGMSTRYWPYMMCMIHTRCINGMHVCVCLHCVTRRPMSRICKIADGALPR